MFQGRVSATASVLSAILVAAMAVAPAWAAGTAQTISFGPIPNRTLYLPFDLSATASSGLKVTFLSLTPSVCTVGNSTAASSSLAKPLPLVPAYATPIALGTCTLAADQAGDANYAAAPQVAQSFPVSEQPTAGQVAAGGIHTCVLTAGGGVKCWQRMSSAFFASQLDVVGLTSGVVSISSGWSHACALAASGGVKCWGYNDGGQLGDGTTAQRLMPVDVLGLSGPVTSISAGELHTCALTTSGGARCWGGNYYGQLGDGTSGVLRRLAPVDVVGLSTPLASIAAGGSHTCALTSGGGVKCWGDNTWGQRGDGTRGNGDGNPVDVLGLSSPVISISASGRHTCALATGGGVKCWGDNSGGQLGDGTSMVSRATPVDVVGLSGGVASIAAGFEHTCALSTTGGVKCWGVNANGQLGDGTGVDRLTPVDVAGLSSGVASISAWGLHTCALMSGGGVKCWGDNSWGQLGDGTSTNRLAPVDFIGLSSTACNTASGDCDNDGIPNGLESSVGRSALFKDNDVFASARLLAMQQYRDFLGREGEATGIQGWTAAVENDGWTRARVVDSFLGSPEFAGVVAPVVRLYFATFLRVPDYAGLVYNAGLVRSGTVELAQLGDFFTTSPEFAAAYGTLDDAAFVTLLYQNVLGRAPDAVGLSGWVGLLDSGYTRGQVLLGFSDSAEYQADMANEVFVTMMYAGMLRRTPEAIGLGNWVGFLDAGTFTREQVINGFFLSSEYRGRFLP